MIAIVTAPPGGGKTLYAMSCVDRALSAGKVVVTNVEMTHDWSTRAARRNPRAWFSKKARARIAAEYERQVLVVTSFDELFRVRVAGCGKCHGCKTNVGTETVVACEREGRWIAVLDELQLWMNSRKWTDDSRQPLVDWFSLHRKLGADVYAITQHENNIDAQVRRLFEVHVRIKPLHKFKIAGIRVVPFKLFVAFHFFNDSSKTLLKRESFTLSKRVAGMYRTMAVAGGVNADPADAIHLPHRLPATAAAPWAPTESGPVPRPASPDGEPAFTAASETPLAAPALGIDGDPSDPFATLAGVFPLETTEPPQQRTVTAPTTVRDGTALDGLRQE